MTTLSDYRAALTARRDELVSDRDHLDQESAKLSAAIHELDQALKIMPGEPAQPQE